MPEFDLKIPSRYLGSPTGVTVLMPEFAMGEDPTAFYECKKQYPVLWLLHAGNGDRNDWLRYTSLPSLLKKRQVIAVLPDGLNSDFVNHPEFAEGYNFADFFFKELMPCIHNWFPASAAPKDNFLAGVSMGSMGAWILAMQHPEKFGGLAPLSGGLRSYSYLEPHRALDASAFRRLAMADRKAFPAGYGNPKNGIWPKEINMICKYATVGEFLDSPEHTQPRFEEAAKAGALPAKLFLAGGTEEPGLNQLKAQAQALGLAGAHYYQVQGPGGHGFEFWNQLLEPMLQFFGV